MREPVNRCRAGRRQRGVLLDRPRADLPRPRLSGCVHASALLSKFAGSDVASSVVGHPVAELLGEELFGAGGTLRQVLERGEMREGWRAAMPVGDGATRIVSLTAAPFIADDLGICDPLVKYIIVLRPAEEDPLAGTAGPTVFFGMVTRSAAMLRLSGSFRTCSRAMRPCC